MKKSAKAILKKNPSTRLIKRATHTRYEIVESAYDIKGELFVPKGDYELKPGDTITVRIV